MNFNFLSIQTSVSVPTAYGTADFISFNGIPGGHQHFAIQFSPRAKHSQNVRIHSECITGDVFASNKCDCGDQLEEALRIFSKEGGTIIYLRQEGRGIGLYEKLKAYQLQASGLDTFEANRALGHVDDARSFDIAAAILHCLQISDVVLFSNNPEKEMALRKHGIRIKEMRSTGTFIKKENVRYLEAKQKFAHHHFRQPLTLLSGAFS